MSEAMDEEDVTDDLVEVDGGCDDAEGVFVAVHETGSSCESPELILMY